MVDTIFQFGEDALNNEANITIDISSLGVPSLKDIIGQDELKFRATGFNVPEKHVLTYDQQYKGFTIQRWKAGTDMTREFTVTFRVDKYWKIYRFLRAWMEFISNVEGDGAYFPDASDNSILRTTATIEQIIKTLNSSGAVSETIANNGWIFSGVFPKSLPDISFDTTSEGDQITIDVTFGFLNLRLGDDA